MAYWIYYNTIFMKFLELKMKKNTHPEYKEVVFLDMSTGKKFICRTTATTSETIAYEGETYPCIKVSITSDSHPFYTGTSTLVDTEGRVDKFKKRYAKKEVEAAPAPVAVAEAKKEKPAKKAPVKKAPAAKKAKKE